MAEPHEPDPADANPEPPGLDELVAWSLDAEPELLPFLPELFADMEELGARVDEVMGLLRPVGLPSGARVLDLGCGKGAVALTLAQEFDCVVHAVDGMPEFIVHAERRADELGVGERCVFATAEIGRAARQSRGYDLVCLLALGDLFGAADQTVAALRRCVKPGGLILIDDAYVRDGASPPEDLVHCFDHETTLGLLQSSGDEVVGELVVDGPESAAHYLEMAARIERRAASLAAAHPEHATLLEGYVQRQAEEVGVLSGPVIGALWLLRRAGGSAVGAGDR